MKFNERLITFRKEKGWSQEELGEKLDVSRQTISKWELGETTPEMDKLIKLGEIFNISIDELIKVQDDDKKETPEKAETKQKGIYEAVVLVLKVVGITCALGLIILVIMIIFGMANYTATTKQEQVRVVEVDEDDRIEDFTDF